MSELSASGRRSATRGGRTFDALNDRSKRKLGVLSVAFPPAIVIAYTNSVFENEQRRQTHAL